MGHSHHRFLVHRGSRGGGALVFAPGRLEDPVGAHQFSLFTVFSRRLERMHSGFAVGWFWHDQVQASSVASVGQFNGIWFVRAFLGQLRFGPTVQPQRALWRRRLGTSRLFFHSHYPHCTVGSGTSARHVEHLPRHDGSSPGPQALGALDLSHLALRGRNGRFGLCFHGALLPPALI